MNSADVSTLKNELRRFEPKPCRTCQFVFGFGVFVFLVSLTLVLFAHKGVPPSAILPIESIPRDIPLSRAEEKMMLDDLRVFAQTHAEQKDIAQDIEESHAGDAARKKAKIIVSPAP